MSGGLIEQLESALLTENQLCSVWQDRDPDLYEHVPSDVLPAGGSDVLPADGQLPGHRPDEPAQGIVAKRAG